MPFRLSYLICLSACLFGCGASSQSESSLFLAVEDHGETRHFKVTSNRENTAQSFADVAEAARELLGKQWFDDPNISWSEPVRVSVTVSKGENMGLTNFKHTDNGPIGIVMGVQGNDLTIRESVLPHEVMHVILATKFKTKIPRWLDEGLASHMESKAEKDKFRKNLAKFFQESRIPKLSFVLDSKEYPRDILPFYSVAQSVTEFLLEKKSEKDAIGFLGEILKLDIKDPAYAGAIQKYYGFATIDELEQAWLEWVRS